MALRKEKFDQMLKTRAKNIDTSTTYNLNDEDYSQDYGAPFYLDQVKDLLDGTMQSSSEFQIDVFPDQRSILLQALYNFKDLNDNLIRANQPNVSKGTLISYVLAQFNVFMYFNDKYKRYGSESSHCKLYDNDPDRANFMDEMSALPIPDFLATTFATLATSTLPVRKNIRFSISAKGFLHEYDFGRFFPISIFLHIHNLIANRDEETSKPQFWKDIFRHSVYKHGNRIKRIGNFFGVFDGDGTTSSYIDSPLIKNLSSYFNDIVSQDIQKRRIYQVLPIQAVSISDTPNYYDMIFAYTANNFRQYREIFRDAAGMLKTYGHGQNTIQGLIFSEDNLRIFAPAYMELTPPTWNYSDIKNVDSIKPMTKEEMSTKLNFKIRPDPTKMNKVSGHSDWKATCEAVHEVEIDEEDDSIAPDKALGAIPKKKVRIERQRTTEPANFTGTLTDYSAAHSSTVEYPPLNEFRVYNNDYTEPGAIIDTPVQLKDHEPMMPFMAGLFIENDEIDGTAVPIPNPDGINSVENSYHLCSALPVLLFYDATQTMPIYSRKRKQRHDDTGIYSGIVTKDRSRMYRNVLTSQFGRISQYNGGPTTVDVLNPGMTIKKVTWRGKEASVIASEILSPYADNVEEASYPNIDHQNTIYKIPGWSCYRYIVDDDSNTVGDIINFDLKKYYFLMNLRTIFGAQVDTIKVTNFFECIPEM